MNIGSKISDVYVRVIQKLSRNGFLFWLTDEKYLKIVFKKRVGYPLNLDNPITFNEKLQWLKIHNRRPIYTTMVDKYAVKNYISKKWKIV